MIKWTLICVLVIWHLLVRGPENLTYSWACLSSTLRKISTLPYGTLLLDEWSCKLPYQFFWQSQLSRALFHGIMQVLQWLGTGIQLRILTSPSSLLITFRINANTLLWWLQGVTGMISLSPTLLPHYICSRSLHFTDLTSINTNKANKHATSLF